MFFFERPLAHGLLSIAVAVNIRRFRNAVPSLLAAVALLYSPGTADAEAKASYQYNLSDFSGTVRYGQVGIYADRRHNEVYAVDGEAVRVFNETGMEIFRFGENGELGAILGMAFDETGDIYTLSLVQSAADTPGGPSCVLIRCNYRGEPEERIAVTGLPPGFSGFVPNAMARRNGRFYLIDMARMKGVVTDKRGAVERGYDFGTMLIEEKDRADAEFFGFAVDDEGSLYFTAPMLFKVFKVSPDGTTASFGKPGGAPGLFNVISGVAVDSRGNIFVSDKLKSVVMVFDRNFRFLEEFGNRGNKPGNLVGPTDLALDGAGRLYVTQLQNRGISVFSLSED